MWRDSVREARRGEPVGGASPHSSYNVHSLRLEIPGLGQDMNIVHECVRACVRTHATPMPKCFECRFLPHLPHFHVTYWHGSARVPFSGLRDMLAVELALGNTCPALGCLVPMDRWPRSSDGREGVERVATEEHLELLGLALGTLLLLCSGLWPQT